MKIFLAAPYTLCIDKKTGIIKQNHKSWLNDIISFLESKNVEIISAHRRERWGENIYSPEDAIYADFKSLDEVDMLFAFIGNPPSSGVLMELGYAASRQKKICIFFNNETPVPYLAQGLNRWTDTAFIEYSNFESLKVEFNKLLPSL